MTAILGRLIGATLSLAAVLAGVTGLLKGPDAALLVVPAVLLCLVPACLTLLWAAWARNRSPEGQLAAFLGGTMLRLACVLGGGLALYLRVEGLRQPLFWVWIIVFYLITLALETGLVLGQPQTEPPAR